MMTGKFIKSAHPTTSIFQVYHMLLFHLSLGSSSRPCWIHNNEWKCVIKWGPHLKYCKTIAHNISSNTPKLRKTSGTLQDHAYMDDHICKQITCNEVTMLNQVTDSEGKLKDYSKKDFHDCFEDEDCIIANVDTHGEFREKILFRCHPKPRRQQLYHSMRWSNQQFYHMFMMPKT